MNKQLILASLGCCSCMILSSCIDNAYDLSDIDTTSRINVNGLVIPVNLDKVTLDDVIDFDENSKIQPVTIDGQSFYALTESGDFHSDPIEINSVKANAPTMPSSIKNLSRTSTPKYKARRSPSAHAVSYKVVEMGDPFSYSASGVDSSIKEISDAKLNNVRFSINLSSQNLENSVSHTYFNDIVIQLPKGLTGTCSVGSYNAGNGQWTIPQLDVNGIATSASFTATAINMTVNDAHLNNSNGTFDLNGEFKILGGTVTLDPKMNGASPATLPDVISFRADYTLSDFEITAFSGSIEYDFEGIDIDPVYLNDIPDFLSCEGTNILLANPQIYLSVNNPIAQYSLNCNAGLSLTSKRPDAPANLQSLSYSTDSPIIVNHTGGDSEVHQFVLAPSNLKLNVPTGYNKNNLTFTPFSSLSNVLAVPSNPTGYSELPESIDIKLTDAKVPLQKVTDFKLGVKLDPVDGSYQLIAPLALKEGSLIIYSDTQDGWNDEDVDALTIEELTLTALADNNTPLDAEIVAYPLDVNGDRIKNVKITSNVLKASSQGVQLEIKLEGVITHLDGVTFEARVKPGSDDALAPSQTIVLNNIRAKVSGYYTKKF